MICTTAPFLSLFSRHDQDCSASGANIMLNGVWTQRLVADLGKGKGKQEITIDATQRDMRMDNDTNYYTHTDATKQFRQARKLGARTRVYALLRLHRSYS